MTKPTAYCPECKEESALELIPLNGEKDYWACECGRIHEDENGEVFTQDELDKCVAYANARKSGKQGPVTGDVEILKELEEIREKLVDLKDCRQEENDEDDCICQNFDLAIDQVMDLAETVKSRIRDRICAFKSYLEEPELEKCVREGYEHALQKLENVIDAA